MRVNKEEVLMNIKKELQNINDLTKQLYQKKQDVLYEGK